MSVSFSISRPGQEIEIVSMFGQRTATEWVGELARKHVFRLFDGSYPIYFYEPRDLETSIAEITIMRDEHAAWLETEQRFEPKEIRSAIAHWTYLLPRLEQVKHEPAAKVCFG